jgi:hypothetical protein
MELDGNTFLIVNKFYDHANLAMWDAGDGSGSRNGKVGTHERKVDPSQFWQLKQSLDHPGYYYIYNVKVKYEGYRIAKFEEVNEKVGAYKGNDSKDQLWKFVKFKGNFYCEVAFVYFDASDFVLFIAGL